MTWSSGRIELDCGHAIGIANWDKLYVGAEVFCPTDRRKSVVTEMTRVYESRPSKDFQLGLVGGGDDDSGS